MLFRPGDGFLHRRSPGVKLGVLAAVSAVLLWRGEPWWSGLVAAAAVLACAASGVPVGVLARTSRPFLVMAALIAAAQVVFGSPWAGLVAGARMAALALAALAVTFTTSPTAIVAWVERVLTGLGVRGDRVFRFGVLVGVALRSIEHLAVAAAGVQDARRARGLHRNLRAFAVPTVVAAGRFAHGAGEALEARGIADPDPPSPPGRPG